MPWRQYAYDKKLKYDFNNYNISVDTSYNAPTINYLGNLPQEEFPGKIVGTIILPRSNLTQIEEFRSVEEANKIDISENKLIDLSGLRSLKTVNDTLNVGANSLKNLNGLENLTYVKTFLVDDTSNNISSRNLFENFDAIRNSSVGMLKVKKSVMSTNFKKLNSDDKLCSLGISSFYGRYDS